MKAKVQYIVTCCDDCPNCKKERTLNAGFAFDYMCRKVIDNTTDYGYKVIAGYVESIKEMPQQNEIPDWCPLRELIP